MERVDALANFSPNAISRYVKAEWFCVPVRQAPRHRTLRGLPVHG